MSVAPLFDAPSGLLAIPVGIAFGATLERVGLGSAHTIADQLRGRDFTVIKVMFSAIVTAMLGIFWATRLGWLDLSRVAIPVTDIVPQLVGAVLFGAGFAVASLCPGTACVSAATGRRDGVLTIAGLFVGTLVVSLAWGALGTVAERAPTENATLATSLGLPVGVVVGAITLIAIITFVVSDRLVGNSTAPRTFRVSPLAAIALAFGLLAAVSGSAPASTETTQSGDGVAPLTVATWIRDRHAHVRVIDIRDSLVADDYRIPGAEEIPAASLAQLTVNAGDTIVIYGDRAGVSGAALASLRARGAQGALEMRGGIAGWEADVLAPRAPDPADSSATARFQAVRELSAWFGGRPTHDAAAVTSAPARRRKNSC